MKFQIYISIPQYNNYKSGLIVIPFAAEQFSKRFNMPSITTTTFRPTTPIGWPQPQPSIRLAQQLRLRRVKAEVEARLRQVEDIIQIHRLMSKLNNCTHFLFSDDAKYSLWPPEVRAFCAWPRTLTSAYLGRMSRSVCTLRKSGVNILSPSEIILSSRNRVDIIWPRTVQALHLASRCSPANSTLGNTLRIHL